MTSKARSRGGGSGCFMRFLVLIVIGYLLISYIPRCAQQLPQMAGNAAAHAANGVANAAGNTVSGWGRSLLHGVEKLLGFAKDQWNNADPAQKFDLVCEHTQVEGVDSVCPYFTSALQGASDAQTARVACYWHAAATSPSSQQIMQGINTLCRQTAATSNPSSLETCLAGQVDAVDPGSAADCVNGSPQQLWPELHTMTEPIACIPGLPKSWCETSSSSSSGQAAAPAPTRTDANYLNCLQKYYLSPAVQAAVGSSCGSSVNAGNAACVKGQLQSFNYPGQSQLGQQYVDYCASQPQ